MKKISSVVLGVLLLVPSLSFAQVATISTSTLTWSQRQSLIVALYAELAVLEQEIQQILTQQAQIQATQTTQSQQIQQIEQNTQITGSEAFAPQSEIPPMLSSIIV